MALIRNITRNAKSGSTSLLKCKMALHNPLRIMSSGSGGNSSFPIIGSNNPSEQTIYDSRKYGHKLPKSNVKPCFPTLEDIPSGVFRCTEGECLGLGAGKNCYYQNPEYFSFHHMSFFDFHVHLKGRRMLQPDSKRKPP